jgi:transcriptional regulator with XRE-family HTH domain
MDMRRLVGRNFARIRREKGLTQEQVEELSGFSQQYISGLEQGRRNPTVVTLYELAQAVGVTPLDLLRDEPEGGTPAGPVGPKHSGNPIALHADTGSSGP